MKKKKKLIAADPQKFAFTIKLLLWAVFFMSLASFLSSLSWICSLLEHLKFIYFIFAFIACLYFILKKNIPYVVLSLVCVCLNFLPTFLLLQGRLVHPPELKMTRQIFLHNVHNGNDEKKYVRQLSTSSVLNVFFEVNHRMNLDFEIIFGKNKKVVSAPSEDNYGWGIWGNKLFKYEKSFSIEETSFIKKVLSSNDNISFYFVHLPPPIFPDLWGIQSQALVWLIAEIQKEKGKVIIAGDFNLTPWSYQFRYFKNELEKRTIRPAKNLYVPSWPSFFPLLPIDHVFSNFPIDAQKKDSLGSDHHQISIRY